MRHHFLLIIFLSISPLSFDIGHLKQIEIKGASFSNGNNIAEPDVINPSAPLDVEGTYQNYSRFFTMNEYFAKLNQNHARNYFGNCGVVALTSLLSYYHTFYDGTIIPEEYLEEPSQLIFNSVWDTSTSPGIKYSLSSLGFKNGPGPEDDDPSGYIDATKDQLFDSYLSYLNNYNIGLGCWDTQTFLQTYYGTSKFVFRYKNSGSANYTPIYETEIKALLAQNIPVILNVYGQTLDENGELKDVYHAVVAHSYDNEHIYCHTGWSNYPTSYDYKLGFSKIYSYGYIDHSQSNLNHVHSKSFIYNNLIYCGCGHHVHDFEATYYSTSYHKYVCACGETKYEEHTNRLFCSICGNNSMLPGEPIFG